MDRENSHAVRSSSVGAKLADASDHGTSKSNNPLITSQVCKSASLNSQQRLNLEADILYGLEKHSTSPAVTPESYERELN